MKPSNHRHPALLPQTLVLNVAENIKLKCNVTQAHCSKAISKLLQPFLSTPSDFSFSSLRILFLSRLLEWVSSSRWSQNVLGKSADFTTVAIFLLYETAQSPVTCFSVRFLHTPFLLYRFTGSRVFRIRPCHS